MIRPRIQTSGSAWWISTSTVGIDTQRTRISARLKLRRNKLVLLRKSRLFQMTTGTRQLPMRPTTRIKLQEMVIIRLMWAGMPLSMPSPPPSSLPPSTDAGDNVDEVNIRMPARCSSKSLPTVDTFIPPPPPPPPPPPGSLMVAIVSSWSSSSAAAAD